ncbi:MAG: flagellar hook-basal body complex protein FliE [Candidatus Melainabacteria bacterium]|jgi:flagellar hook-basal body complex protein FliE|nr:flagellar hook-basal body complex protein FliE [Candidatus Melainabacteria bacterium]
MTIEPVKFSLQAIETPLLKASVSYSEAEPQTGKEGFAAALGTAIQSLKTTHAEAAHAMQDYSSGRKDIDITQVMLTLEKSQVATDLAIQVRNKFVEGFNELIRIQI